MDSLIGAFNNIPIRKKDSSNTLFYLDPPYLHQTRTSKKKYTFEMSPEDHEKLLKLVLECKSKFVISGYDNEMYKHKILYVTSENIYDISARIYFDEYNDRIDFNIISMY